MKVFENLPSEVNRALIQGSNDCYIKWYVMEEYPEREYYDSDEEFEEELELYKDSVEYIVHTWLIEQGCKVGEKVILEHMW